MASQSLATVAFVFACGLPLAALASVSSVSQGQTCAEVHLPVFGSAFNKITYNLATYIIPISKDQLRYFPLTYWSQKCHPSLL